MRSLDAVWLGTVPYADALGLQSRLHESRQRDEAADTLLQLEHSSVFTIGRRGTRGDVLWDEATLAERGVEVHEADRGGMVTYHGPGQLVGYPIVHLGPTPDLERYVRDLEAVLIDALAGFGVTGERVQGRSGVWIGTRKIGAIGVKVSRGVTKHGYALNVSTDLSYFGGIVPCGITDRGVTSIQELTGAAPDANAVGDAVAASFADVFVYQLRPRSALEVSA
ncbi:MAG TPA: lipoyl(octanoyl) transferase LipB [Actinomycetota bacterium]|nr:lipoyl(octanoyl) transferase LipB [Actinomycetota bacterium]